MVVKMAELIALWSLLLLHAILGSALSNQTIDLALENDFDYYDFNDVEMLTDQDLEVPDPTEIKDLVASTPAPIEIDYDDYEASSHEILFQVDETPRDHLNIQNFLTQSSVEMLKSVSNDVLTDYSKHEAIFEVLPTLSLAKLQILLDRLPANVSADIAAREGLLAKMSDERVVLFASNIDVLNKTSSPILLQLANKRPNIVPQLPNEALRYIISRPFFVKSLEQETIQILVHSAAMAEKLKHMPKEVVAMIVTYHPVILTWLPKGYYPLKSVVMELMQNKSFLALIPVEVHAFLAETKFRYQLNPRTVLTILNIYPNLPTQLSPKGLEFNRIYLQDQKFLTKLKCSVFLNCANNVDFINRLNQEDIRALAQNRHMWKCLPVSLIRKLMKESKLGTNLDVKEVFTAATTMSRAKSLDWGVVSNLMKFQVPDMARNFLFREKFLF
ncbi:hypothetical protein TCAL_16123 [Tigriopus californicus]|uniref:Uncharacterized protein n=1 Tax=Tigriopus californicus TaxID=6832 RepID=A0A553PNA0_TIGCA|nr:uncharacterized protein LOC131882404 [Tigriopus californicus]TRY79157.1 hypothetical protein TCAL_16123 [Tigriopus californicus]